MKSEIPIDFKKGYKKFLNCKIDLKKRIFIPRVETEFWVKKTIKKIKKSKQKIKKIKILDIFAGSGCIGISILKNLKNSFVDFVDIDKKAIEQIKINLNLNKIPKNRYKIYKSDLFEKIKEKYNFIFANPPYVAKERIFEVQKSVKDYEPKISWYGGKEGLKYIKKFLKEAKKYLKKGGEIYLEFDPLQKQKIEMILIKENYKKFKFFKDQFKKWRYLKICYNY